VGSESENEDSAACRNLDRRFPPDIAPWPCQQEFAKNRMLLWASSRARACHARDSTASRRSPAERRGLPGADRARGSSISRAG
jgi:hypothetical protein